MSRKIRIGVVGGRYGAEFFWHEHPNCVVEAVADLHGEWRKHLMHVYRCGKSYQCLDDLLADKDVDAVALYTGVPWHAEHAIACLNAGKHVLCADPVGITIEQCEQVLEAVRRSGLTYMLSETSWYHQSVITARKWYREGWFGRIFYTESEYHHPGLDSIAIDFQGNRNWRYGLAPMHYPTHCTAYLVGVTGESLVRVSCMGWGDDCEMLKDNEYGNPFWNETAFFATSQGNALRASVYWKAAVAGCVRGQWFGERMTLQDPTPDGQLEIKREIESDYRGFVVKILRDEDYRQKQWWQSEMLPEPLRHQSAHENSHVFITHEFVDALVNGREPEIDIYAALALSVPGIVAHESALQGGRQLEIPQYLP